jgi:hypothetical protein
MTVDRITRNQRLLDLAKTIEEAPDHQLDMKTWMIDKRPDDWEFMDDGNHQTEEVRSALLNHTCGTAACVAGWAVALFAEDMTVNLDIEEEAKKLLGLNNREAEIFYESLMIAETM